MSRKLIVRNRATQDVRLQANYILANGNTAAAERFLERVEFTFSMLLRNPGIGKVMTFTPDRMGEVRQWRVKSFTDHLVFYQVADDRVEVMRVMHGARDLENIWSQLEPDF